MLKRDHHLTMTAAIWHNWTTDQPIKRSLTAFDHRSPRIN